MKKLLLLFSLSILGLTANAQMDSTIYGISADNNNMGLYLSKINPTTGVVTTISSNVVNFTLGGLGRTIDPNHHIFYYTPDSMLLSFKLNTGELIGSKPVINYLSSAFNGITYDCRDSSLYGIAVDVSGQEVRLAKLNPNTGLVTPVSNSSVASSFRVLTGTALDPIHGVFYFETVNNPANHLIGISMISGSIVSDVAIGIGTTDRFGPLVYNCGDSILYGLAGNLTDGRKLGKINPASGEVTIISQNIIVYSILNEPATIDPVQELYYFEGVDYKFNGVSINTGEIVTQPLINPSPHSYFSAFFYNHTCYYDNPQFIGEKSSDPVIRLFPDPASDFLNIISSLPLSQADIIDVTGKLVSSMKCKEMKNVRIDLTNVDAGLYVIFLHYDNSFKALRFIKVAGPSL